MKRLLKFTIPATGLLALSALLSRVLGVVRDHLLARTFGASAGMGIYNLDAYYAAFRIPDLLYNLLIYGAISAAFIPIFTRYKKQGDLADGWRFAGAMLNSLFLLVLVLSGVVFVLAPKLVYLVAGGFNAEALELTVKLMRILLLSPILMSLSAIFISLQDSFKTFFYRSLAPLFYNIGIIAGVVWWGKEFGVVGVTWGVILGAFLQLIVQIPALIKMGYRYRFGLGLGQKDVREAYWLMIPRVMGLSMNQLTLFVNTLIASFLATGSITIFYLADNLQAVPLGMIGISFAITSFATLSELASEPTPKAFAAEVRRVMRQVLWLILPATLGLIALRSEVIGLILQYGRFTEQDAALTANVVGLLAISLFAQSLIPTLARGFYAYKNTRTPFFAALLGAFVSIGGSVFLTFAIPLGIGGIALAYSVGNIVNAGSLYWSLNHKIGEDLMDWKSAFKYLVAATLMMLAILITKNYLPMTSNILEKIVWLALLVAGGAAAYFGLLRLTKAPSPSV